MTHTNPDKLKRALPFGRALRLLLGIILMAYLIPIYGRLGVSFLFRTVLLILALLAAYSFIHLLASRSLLGFNSWLGTALANTLLIAVYLAGGLGGLFFGKGEGQLAAGTFLAISLLLAGVRGDAGCELMSIPGALFAKRSQLGCVVFSPVDWLERKLRGSN
jgi:hypothetical protein